MRFIVLLFLSNLAVACNNISIIQKPIVFDKERVALTQQYRLKHYDIKSKSIVIQPRMIVLHWTQIKDISSTYNVFYPAVLSNRPDISKGGNLNVSAHFLVDRDGKIYQLMPTNWMARHVIGLNDVAIGIENVGGVDDREDLTAAQVNANVCLVRYLKKQYPTIEYLIGHYEYGEFRYTKLWKEKDSNYFTAKKDTGEKFMRLVRGGLIHPVLSPENAKAIGEKIWQNECNGKISGLTSWNKGENFASLGIGHCIWYPAGKQDIFEESFPKLIQYMRARHVVVPKWLDKPDVPACPWQSREEFLRAIKNNELRLWELRQFLINTVPEQTQYLIYRLETLLPQILELVPVGERPNIQHEIEQLIQTPIGIYSLVDYINFKGDGILESFSGGWGLLQVLREMQHAPNNLTPNEAYAWAASKVLKRRVASAPQARKMNEKRWLTGWLKRVNTYREDRNQ
ncbi:MAG: peptidoglycan recognition family protein [bacterium]